MSFFYRKPRWSFRRWLKLGFTIAVIMVVALSFMAWQLARPAGPAGELREFSIESGEGVNQISQELAVQELIHSRLWFEFWVWLSRTEADFLAGDYQLPTNVNVINLVRLLTGALEPSSELSVRFIEGWTIQQMSDYLQRNSVFAEGDFSTFVTVPINYQTVTAGLDDNFFSQLPRGASLEGYLFPDTYRLYHNATVSDLVSKMLNNTLDKFPPDWRAEITKRGYSIHEAMTLASIVEREVASDKDRAMVAGIFWRRLEAGRGLEADSTINYITGKRTPAVSAEDLSLDSPYNTYRYRGLPPGPISNPGSASIQAVVYPQANQYWYFLSAPDGEVIYSTTFEEHKQAKQKYLR